MDRLLSPARSSSGKAAAPLRAAVTGEAALSEEPTMGLFKRRHRDADQVPDPAAPAGPAAPVDVDAIMRQAGDLQAHAGHLRARDLGALMHEARDFQAQAMQLQQQVSQAQESGGGAGAL